MKLDEVALLWSGLGLWRFRRRSESGLNTRADHPLAEERRACLLRHIGDDSSSRLLVQNSCQLDADYMLARE